MKKFFTPLAHSILWGGLALGTGAYVTHLYETRPKNRIVCEQISIEALDRVSRLLWQREGVEEIKLTIDPQTTNTAVNVSLNKEANQIQALAIPEHIDGQTMIGDGTRVVVSTVAKEVFNLLNEEFGTCSLWIGYIYPSMRVGFPSDIRAYSSDKINHLSTNRRATVLEYFTPEQIQSVDISIFNWTDLGRLSTEQIRALTPEQINKLEPSDRSLIIKHFSAEQIQAIDPSTFDWADFGQLSEDQIELIDGEKSKVEEYYTLNIPELGEFHLDDLSVDQIQALTPEQINGLKASERALIIKHFTIEQIQVIDPSKFAPIDLRHLSKEQVQALTAEQISGIVPLNRLIVESYLSLSQLNSVPR